MYSRNPYEWIPLCRVCLFTELQENGKRVVKTDPFYTCCVICGGRENIFIARIPSKEAVRFSPMVM